MKAERGQGGRAEVAGKEGTPEKKETELARTPHLLDTKGGKTSTGGRKLRVEHPGGASRCPRE